MVDTIGSALRRAMKHNKKKDYDAAFGATRRALRLLEKKLDI